MRTSQWFSTITKTQESQLVLHYNESNICMLQSNKTTIILEKIQKV